MADNTTLFKIKAIVQGAEGVEKLKRSIRDLHKNSTPAARDLAKLRAAANELGRSSHKTENSIRTQIAVLKDLRTNVSLTGSSYQKLGRQIKQAEASLKSFSGKGGFRAGAMAAAPAALGGATASFLPAPAQFGAAAGFAKGGMAGDLAGAGISLGVSAVAGGVQQAAEAAKYASEVKRLQIALKGVTKDSVSYAKAQRVITSVSKELNVPIGVATKQFTTLSASVLGAGGTIEDAEEVFRGVSEAIKATGGESEDIQSAIRAMSQIFGKGKVSAEELQGQLGERLPGAVVKFAEATNRTLPQLQKDLRDGTVGLNDVMKFVTKLSGDHREAALDMASSSEEAGQRMNVALKQLQFNFGEFFQPIGAGFQNIVSGFANMVNAAFESARKLKEASMADELKSLQQQLEQGMKLIGSEHGLIGKIPVEMDEDDRKEIEAKIEAIKAKLQELEDAKVTPEDLIGDKDKWKVTTENATDALSNYVKEVNNVMGSIRDAGANALKGLEDAFVKFVTDGKFMFKDLARSIIADLARIAVQQTIMKPLTSWLFPSAKGNVFAANQIVPFAKGGIIDRPTIFPLAKGAALAGEQGAEAIIPLKRGKGGRLGVEGGGGTSIVVNVDASGSEVQGDEAEGRQLGQLIAAVVQNEIVQQQRPGGLLA
jgi:tape measure domain-containing protein